MGGDRWWTVASTAWFGAEVFGAEETSKTERIWRRSGMTWTMKESSDVPRRVGRQETYRHLERGQILTTAI